MKNDYLAKPVVVAFLAFICCALWGSAIPMIKTGYRLMGIEASDIAAQIVFAGIRFTIAGLLVLAFAGVRERRPILPGGNVMKLSFLLCLAQTVGQYFFFYIGVAHTSGVKASIMSGLGNFFAILMACVVFRREKMTGNKLLGCILGFAGVVIINVFGKQIDMGLHILGEGSMLLAQIAYALSNVLISSFSRQESPVILSGSQFFIGGLILSGIGFAMGGRISVVSLPAVLILLYLAFVSAMAYTLWSILLAHNPVSGVAIYGFMNPLCSVILSALVLGEKAQAFNWGSLLALTMVCAGIYIVNRPKRTIIPRT